MGWRTGLGPVPMASLQSEAEAGLGLCRPLGSEILWESALCCIQLPWVTSPPPAPQPRGETD